MALKVELPKQLCIDALTQFLSLKERNARAATNPIIKQALEEECRAVEHAKQTVTELLETAKVKAT